MSGSQEVQKVKEQEAKRKTTKKGPIKAANASQKALNE
jgi:hypothetical protein